jgi:cytochrome c oxidase subunit II
MSSSPRTNVAPVLVTAGVVVILVVLLAALSLTGQTDPITALGRAWDSMFPPQAVTEQGRDIRNLYDVVFIIAAIIFFVVEGLIVWTVIRYRRRPGDDELPPQTHGNNLAETLWTVGPTVIVAFLFVISWQTLNRVDAVSASPDVQVRAVAGQFQWSFVYLAEDGQTELFTQLAPLGENGGLAVPVGRTIQLQLHSPDVIHAFYVPRFLFKKDVVPGQTNRFDFKIDEEHAGQTFHGQCAELCGTGHRVMEFEVRALTQADYDTWLQQQIDRAQQSPPPAPSGPAGSPGAPPAGPPIELSAVNVVFDKQAIEAPADAPFSIHFVNNDASVPHDVAIQDDTGSFVFNGDDLTGPTEATYNVPPLPSGQYTFVCTFHANMTGTLTVQ